MVKNKLQWVVHVERKLVDFVVRRVECMKRSQIARGSERSRKIIREVIKNDLKIKNLDKAWS